MNRSRDQKDTIRAKLEGDSNNTDKLSKAIAHAASSSSTTSTSRQWSGFKNPRIVRVSRTFGGKDRHSKVCTVRGLRDRRIRLSVPTAVQLYELQDRLGLSQPSKVIDWLLDATKLDIDELPPLQFPPGDFAQFHQQSLIGQLANAGAPPHHFTPYLDANLTLMKDGPTHNSSSSVMLSSKDGIDINDNLDEDEDREEDELSLEAKLEKIKWSNKASNSHEDHYQGGGNGSSSSTQISAQSFFPMGGSGSFLPNLMNSSSALPYNNFYHWDPSNLSLSQMGSHGFLVPSEESNQSNIYAGGNSTHQLFFCPPMPAATTSLFPQQDNRFHPSTASLSPFHSSGSALKALAPHELHSAAESNGHQPNKGDNGSES